MIHVFQFFNAQQKIQDVVDSVRTYLNDQCNCGVTSDHIRESKFICPQSDPTKVIYRARLFAPFDISDPQRLVQTLQQWVESESRSFVIAGFRLLVDQTCNVSINSFNDAECGITISSVVTPTVSPTPSQAPNGPGTYSIGAQVTSNTVVRIGIGNSNYDGTTALGTIPYS